MKKRPIAVRVVPHTQLKLEQWQQSPELVKSARKLLETNEFQIMLAVLRNENPSNYGIRGYGATHDDHVAHAFKAAGYSQCLANLESMAFDWKPPVELEATFGANPPGEPVPSKE